MRGLRPALAEGTSPLVRRRCIGSIGVQVLRCPRRRQAPRRPTPQPALSTWTARHRRQGEHGKDFAGLAAVPQRHARHRCRTLTGSVALAGPGPAGQTGTVIRSNVASCAPAGYRFPREVIAVAVRWYLRYGLSYRDVEELLAARGVTVDQSRCTGGYRHSRRSSSPPRGRPAMRPVIGGSSTRPTSRSLDGGPTCTGRLISMVR